VWGINLTKHKNPNNEPHKAIPQQTTIADITLYNIRATVKTTRILTSLDEM